MPDKITDWADLMSNKICETVKAYMVVAEEGDTVENMLEQVLAYSCAGPKTIAMAKAKLGIA
jgi:hypothetical protein